MSKKSFSFKKCLSSFLIIALISTSSFGFLGVKKAGAQWVVYDPANFGVNLITSTFSGITAGSAVVSATANTVHTTKDTILDAIAWFAIDAILRQLTAQTVNWINSGFKGNPAYVTNPDKFFLGIADKTANRFLNTGGALDALCSPFQSQIRLALVRNYLQEDQPPSCTIDKIVKNYDSWINNFENGGWEAWFSMTMNDNNNPYGAYMKSRDQLSVQVNSQQAKYKDQLNWGQGFLSFERCARKGNVARKVKTYGDYAEGGSDESGGGTDIFYDDTVGETEVVDENVCVQKETVTPGSIVNNQLKKALGTSVDRLAVADEINEIASALMTQLLSKVIGGISSGIRGLGEKGSGEDQNRTALEEILKTGDESPSAKEDLEKEELLRKSIPSSYQEIIDGTNKSPTDYVNPNKIQQEVEDEKARFKQENPVAPGSTFTTPPQSTTPPADNTDDQNQTTP